MSARPPGPSAGPPPVPRWHPEVEDAPEDARPWRRRLHAVIFEAETREGKLFDVALIGAIAVSILVLMLESVVSIRETWGAELRWIEVLFTGVFTVEYLLRLAAVRRPVAYATSLWGVIDLLSVLPTWLAFFLPGAKGFIVLRILRLLRIFRVFKLAGFVNEGRILRRALHASRRKVGVFLTTVVCVVVIVGTLLYTIEGAEAGFESIPHGVYWAIVTLTTVGYGDIAPITLPGRMLAGLVMLLGWGVLAVPTGIVTVEIANASKEIRTKACHTCGHSDHDLDASYCKHCGATLDA